MTPSLFTQVSSHSTPPSPVGRRLMRVGVGAVRTPPGVGGGRTTPSTRGDSHLAGLVSARCAFRGGAAHPSSLAKPSGIASPSTRRGSTRERILSSTPPRCFKEPAEYSRIQKITEEIILKLCKSISREHNIKNLCLAGGVALNCVANGKILKEEMRKLQMNYPKLKKNIVL